MSRSRPEDTMTAEDDLREGKAIRQTLPELIINAGTHKTASTYIQERLHCNKALLLQWGIDVQDPQLDRPKLKRLVSALCNQRWNEWNDFLKHKNHQHDLASAEQFSVPFTNPEYWQISIHCQQWLQTTHRHFHPQPT